MAESVTIAVYYHPPLEPMQNRPDTIYPSARPARPLALPGWGVYALAGLLLAVLMPVGTALAQSPPAEQGLLSEELFTDSMALDAADRLFLAGDMRGAATAYKQALAAFPDSEYLDQALYRLGSALAELGRHDDAREYWERLLDQAPNSPFAEEVGAELLAIYHKEGMWDRALDILLTQLGRAPLDRKADLLREIASVRLSLGEPERALKDLLRRQRYLAPEQRQAGLEEIRSLVEGQLTVADLEALSPRFTEPVPGAWIMERLVQHYLASGEVYQTDRWASRYQAAFPKRPLAKRLKKLIKQQRKALRDHRHRVAVLLPLSGPMGDYGQPVLNGIKLAYRQAVERLPEGELALWVRDRDTERPLLGGHVKPLLKAADPEILIGPLLSREVAQASRLTRAAHVPLIAPLVPPPPKADRVVGLGVTPEMEGIAAARYAYRSAGLERFVIVKPIGRYGDRIAEAFSAELVRLGGSIQDTLTFEPGAPGLRQKIKKLVAADLRADGVAEVTEEDMAHLEPDELALAGLLEEEQPTIEIAAKPTPPLQGPPVGPHPYYPGFDAVFLPGDWEQVVRAAPLLPFNDVNVPLIGSAGWNDLRIIKKGGQAVMGARFVSPLYRGEQPGLGFMRAYKAAYDQSPDLFAALGYDAMKLALRALVEGEERHWNGADTWSRLPGPFAGVSGIIRIEPDGNVTRDLGVLKIGRHGFRQLERVPVADEPDPVPDTDPAFTPMMPSDLGHMPEKGDQTGVNRGEKPMDDPDPFGLENWVIPSGVQ